MDKQYSIVVAAVISAVVQALCTVALEKLGNIDLLRAAAIALLPSLIILGALVFLLYLRKRRSPDRSAVLAGTNSVRTCSTEVAEFGGSKGSVLITKESVANQSLFELFSQIGLVEIAGKLSESPFTPDACAERATRSLSFLGVLGSKWVNDPPVRDRFSNFLSSVEAKDGHVRFCLINPWGPAYKKLHGFRDGKITWESLWHYQALKERYGCLEVRLYDALPSFRLIFIDEKVCIVARYKTDGRGYITTRYGWEAPHLSFLAEADWSFYEPFSSYFNEFWSRAKSIDKFREQLNGR
jgi:hypothetical protein